MMMRKSNLVLAIGVVVAGSAVSIATADRVPSPTLRVLASAPTKIDRLPRSIRESSFRPILATPIRARYVGTSPIGFRFFAIKGRDGYVCLIGTKGRGEDAETYGICREQKVLSRDAIWVSRGDAKQGTADIAALAADGLTSATAGKTDAPIKSNVFFLRIKGETTAALTGKGLKTLKVTFG